MKNYLDKVARVVAEHLDVTRRLPAELHREGAEVVNRLLDWEAKGFMLYRSSRCRCSRNGGRQ
jgi:hypothetical protein